MDFTSKMGGRSSKTLPGGQVQPTRQGRGANSSVGGKQKAQRGEDVFLKWRMVSECKITCSKMGNPGGGGKYFETVQIAEFKLLWGVFEGVKN